MKFLKIVAYASSPSVLTILAAATFTTSCSSDSAYRSSHVRRYAVPPLNEPRLPKPPKRSTAAARTSPVGTDTEILNPAPPAQLDPRTGAEPRSAQARPMNAPEPYASSRTSAAASPQPAPLPIKSQEPTPAFQKPTPGDFPASATSGMAAASTTKKSLPQSYAPRLGLISLVNNNSDFVLIDIGTSPAPAPGSRLQAYSAQRGSAPAELSVSNYQRRPFLIADIISGDPRVGDSVVQISKSGGIPPSVPPAPADVRFNSTPTQRESKPFWKSERDDSTNSQTIFFEPANQGGSDRVIPGLPARRGN